MQDPAEEREREREQDYVIATVEKMVAGSRPYILSWFGDEISSWYCLLFLNLKIEVSRKELLF